MRAERIFNEFTGEWEVFMSMSAAEFDRIRSDVAVAVCPGANVQGLEDFLEDTDDV